MNIHMKKYIGQGIEWTQSFHVLTRHAILQEPPAVVIPKVYKLSFWVFIEEVSLHRND
jgi:hypothetical protein